MRVPRPRADPRGPVHPRRHRPARRTGSPGRRPAGLAADPGPHARRSLARVDQRGLGMHRLTQAILRDQLTPGQAAATRSAPRRSWRPATPATRRSATWPAWAQLMPHLLAADLAAPAPRPAPAGLRRVLVSAGPRRYPHRHDFASDLRQQWRDRLGDDHEHTLTITHYLAWALQMGRYAEARDLDQDTLDRRRRSWATTTPTPCTPPTTSPSTCASSATSRPPATWPKTPWPAAAGSSATTTAAPCPPPPPGPDLRALGEVQAARDLNQDTLDRRRRILGDDHPDTLNSATTWPTTCARSARSRPPATWTRTPWTAAAGSWATTTPTP